MTERRRVALCVDDFGLHEGVNAAVFRLAELGRVNAVSCMVAAPAWASSAAALAALPREAIELGLHLDLTEYPVQQSPRRLPQLIAAAYARRLDRKDLGNEIEAQLDAFEQHAGRSPDYVDGHQHVHQLPVVRDVLLQALSRRYRGRLPWLRSTRAAAPRSLKPRIIETLGAAGLRRAAKPQAHRFSGRLLGVHGFKSDATQYAQLLDQWFAMAEDGDLLMCHPAASTTKSIDDPLIDSRHAEFEVLSDKDFDKILARHNIELVPISRTAANAQSA